MQSDYVPSNLVFIAFIYSSLLSPSTLHMTFSNSYLGLSPNRV